jgi:ABC-type multidrug transport system fused ATPase/permease subunit
MALSSRVKQKPDAKGFVYQGGKIEFKDINFSFKTIEAKPKYLLSKLNLTIEPHKETALVGPSGFGKTTIFNLIVSSSCLPS